MSKPLQRTFQYLSQSDNETAVRLLISTLNSSFKPAREGSLLALLKCRNLAGHREVFRRLPAMDEQMRLVIREQPDRLVCIIAEVLRESDLQAHQAAYETVTKFRLYDAMPVLVSKLVDPTNSDTSQTAHTILKLSESFYNELSETEAATKLRDIERLRTKITIALEDAVRKFHRHRQREVAEAFLLLAKPKNATLHFLLSRSSEAAYETVLDLLVHSTRGGVKRLLLGFLSDPQIPHALIRAIGNRCDAEFVGHLLRYATDKPSKNILETIGRFEEFAWAVPGHAIFANLDEEAQAGAVSLLMASHMDRNEVREVLGYLLLHGKVGGRRAAAEAIAQFSGFEAASLVIRGLQDDDPGVRASLLGQLRPRNIPGALELLLGMVDHPHPEILEALRKAMPEFSINNFLKQFDHLPEDLRMSTGYLVCKMDPHSATRLIAEMQGLSPVRRRRAILIAEAMDLVSEVEQQIIVLLSDDDHMVRTAAAQSLANCKSMPSWEALRDAMLDRSMVVQQAAEKSLELISRSLSSAMGNEVEEEEPIAV